MVSMVSYPSVLRERSKSDEAKKKDWKDRKKFLTNG